MLLLGHGSGVKSVPDPDNFKHSGWLKSVALNAHWSIITLRPRLNIAVATLEFIFDINSCFERTLF